MSTKGDEKSTNTITFNNTTIITPTRPCRNSAHLDVPQNDGSLINSRAPYPSKENNELAVLGCTLLPSWKGILEPILQSLSKYQYWQYGSGNYGSARKKTIESTALPCLSDCRTTVFICHFALNESSQWVIGQNVTFNETIFQIDNPPLMIRGNSSQLVN